MKEKANWVPRLWFPGRDRGKNPLRRELADAAMEDCEHLLEYAERHSIDPAQAQNIAEALVEDISSKQQGTPSSERIKKPRSYLRAAFMHAVDALEGKDERFKRVDVADLERLGAKEDWPEQLDKKILVREIVSMMDLKTRRTYWRRSEGYKWNEIARGQGMRINTAIAVYTRGLTKVRERVVKGRQRSRGLSSR
jgi:hypothetical protein